MAVLSYGRRIPVAGREERLDVLLAQAASAAT
jgi:hypothetical protein